MAWTIGRNLAWDFGVLSSLIGGKLPGEVLREIINKERAFICSIHIGFSRGNSESVANGSGRVRAAISSNGNVHSDMGLWQSQVPREFSYLLCFEFRQLFFQTLG